MFSETDKFLILNTLISLIKKKEISNIEIARVLVLTNIDNQKLLSDNYRNIEGYKILSNGVHQRNNQHSKIKWILDILNKLEAYNLKSIKKELRLVLKEII